MGINNTVTGDFDHLDEGTWDKLHEEVHEWASRWLEGTKDRDLSIPAQVRMGAGCMSRRVVLSAPRTFFRFRSRDQESKVMNAVRMGILFGYQLAQEVMNEDAHLPDITFESEAPGVDLGEDAPRSGDDLHT